VRGPSLYLAAAEVFDSSNQRKASDMQNQGQKYLPFFGLPRSLIEFLGIIISLLQSTQDVASFLQISDEMREDKCFHDLNLKATFGPGATFLGFLIQEPLVLRLVLWLKQGQFHPFC
jgi:hypothetical protein